MFTKWREWLGGLRRDVPAASPIAPVDYKLLTENTLDLIIQFGLDGKLSYVSPSSASILGWSDKEMLTLKPEDVVHPDDIANALANINTVLSGGPNSEMKLTRFLHKNGEILWLEGNRKPIRNKETGKIEGIVVVLRDATERKKQEEKLIWMALTDGLTGLANRRALDETLRREWDVAIQQGTDLSFLLLDVDHFKGFNDRYGHQVGDDCLCSIANVIKNTLPLPGELAARYGGEELAIILPNTNSLGAAEVAERIRAAVQALCIPHAINKPGNGYISVSLGVATMIALKGVELKTPAGLLAAADTALYKAKEKGRNQIATTILINSSEAE